jgi:WXG100 family type VII secretion target
MTDGSYTSVVFAALAEGESDLQRAYQQATTTVETLLSQLGSSLSLWVGSAQTAYHSAQNTWNTAQSNMATVMSQLGTVVGTANDNYIATENINQQMWT